MKTEQFRGMRWLADPHKLGSEYAVEANNLWPRSSGGLHPLRFGLKATGIEAEGGDWSYVKSAYTFNNRLIGSTINNIDFVEHPVQEVHDRLYFVDPGTNPSDTNQGLIKFYDGDSIPSGQVLDLNSAHRLGVTNPAFRTDDQPFTPIQIFHFGVDPSGETGRDIFLTNIVYTFVNKWGEESAPSPASEDFKYRRSSSVINFRYQGNLTGDSNIVGFRAYMAINGSYFRVNDYYNVKTYESGGYKVENLTGLISGPDASGTVLTTIFTVSDAPNEELVSITWDRAPQGIKHLIALDNRVLVGARENEVCMSVPGYIHAFPADTIHRRKIPGKIKGMAKVQGGFVVLTDIRAHLFLGYSAETMVEVNVDFPYPLGDKRSLVTIDGSAIWITNEGIAAMGSNGGQMLTSGWTERDTWKDYIDFKNCQCEVHEQRLILFSNRPAVSQPKGYIFDLRLQEVVSFDCSTDALDGLVYRDPESGEVWFSHDTNGLNRFNRGSYMVSKWRSGRIDVPQGYIPGGCYLQSDQGDGSGVLNFDMGIGEDVDGTRNQAVTTNMPFWCGIPWLARWFQFQIESNNPVSHAIIDMDIQDA